MLSFLLIRKELNTLFSCSKTHANTFFTGRWRSKAVILNKIGAKTDKW
jgi:hypothetical protein